MNRRNKNKAVWIRSHRAVLLLLGVSLAAGLLFAQKPSLPKHETITIKGRTLASVDRRTGYLRGGFGDSYQVFVFGLEPSNHGDPIAPTKVMYRFFKSEPALPDSFLDASKRYELQVVREPKCDETVQSLSYEENSDENGRPLPSSYILRPLDGAPKDVLKPDVVLACYVMSPGKYKGLSQRNHQG